MRSSDELSLVVIAFLLVIVFVVYVVFAFFECNGATRDIGLAHRFQVFGGCQVQVEDGTWMPLDNYRYID